MKDARFNDGFFAIDCIDRALAKMLKYLQMKSSKMKQTEDFRIWN